jgi:ribulose-5-phosphate 4-epimerase/fuculose-1-phosphate aldolase
MLTAIGDVMRECYKRGWITTRDGNIGLRRKASNILYITPSGWRKTIIHPEHIVRVRILKNGKVAIPNGHKPSGELHMHTNLLLPADGTRAVLHAHPTHIVAAMFRGFDLQQIGEQFVEIFRYTRVGPMVGVLPATTKSLGDATALAFGQNKPGASNPLAFDIVGQAAHGATAVAKDPWSAFEHIERLDHICEIVLKSGISPTEFKQKAKKN